MKKIPSEEYQVGGNHYRGYAIQPARYIHSRGMPYSLGSPIKRALSYAANPDPEEAKKAIHELRMYDDYMQAGIEPISIDEFIKANKLPPKLAEFVRYVSILADDYQPYLLDGAIQALMDFAEGRE